MSDITGGCYCGAIRYRILESPGTGICYCENCRKAVGAQSVAWVNSHRNAVDIVKGEPARYAAPNGAVWSFCAQCGSTLFWERTAQPDELAVTTGSLDDPAAFPPETSSWDEDRLPWVAPFHGPGG